MVTPFTVAAGGDTSQPVAATTRAPRTTRGRRRFTRPACYRRAAVADESRPGFSGPRRRASGVSPDHVPPGRYQGPQQRGHRLHRCLVGGQGDGELVGSLLVQRLGPQPSQPHPAARRQGQGGQPGHEPPPPGPTTACPGRAAVAETSRTAGPQALDAQPGHGQETFGRGRERPEAVQPLGPDVVDLALGGHRGQPPVGLEPQVLARRRSRPGGGRRRARRS